MKKHVHICESCSYKPALATDEENHVSNWTACGQKGCGVICPCCVRKCEGCSVVFCKSHLSGDLCRDCKYGANMFDHLNQAGY